MSLELQGTLTKILPVEDGTSKAGKAWKKQAFVINTGDDYNPEVCFSVFGDDKVDALNQFSVGDNVNVLFNVSSREFKGKYYHNLDAWKMNSSSGATSSKKATTTTAVDEDDLPF